MTLGMLSLGDVTDLLDSGFSGFDYPNNATLTPTLSDGTSVRNAVLQESGLGFRQAKVTFTAETADALTIRGYYEARTEVSFTDADGSTSDVVILDYSRALHFGDLWEVSVTLLETSDPVPAGS